MGSAPGPAHAAGPYTPVRGRTRARSVPGGADGLDPIQQGLVVMYRTQPEKPLLFLADWLRKNNPQTFKQDHSENGQNS